MLFGRTRGDNVTNQVERFFQETDRAAIEAAVKEAEGRTSGEIVPVAVGRSGDYPQAAWSGALLGALTGAVGAAAVIELGGLWLTVPAMWVAVATLIGAGLGWLATVAAPPLTRTLAGAEAMERAVAARAVQAFVEHEAFATSERTGIVILVSLFERRVHVLGDAGINARVAQNEWDGIAAAVAAGIRAGTPGPALAEGIRRCGELLERGGVERRADDVDELADRLRMEER